MAEIKREEIQEPKRTNLYWARYWKRMNENLGCNHFYGNAYAMKEQIVKGCGKKTRESSWCGNPRSYDHIELCEECQETLKILNEILYMKFKEDKTDALGLQIKSDLLEIIDDEIDRICGLNTNLGPGDIGGTLIMPLKNIKREIRRYFEE